MKKHYIHITILLLIHLVYPRFFPEAWAQQPSKATIYYMDAVRGNDKHNGVSPQTPWKSLSKLDKISLFPGDTIKFKRGSSFIGPLFIRHSGKPEAMIVLTDYGEITDPAPAFTNKVFKQDNFGNCIRIKGSYILVENLYFHDTPVYKKGVYKTDGGWDVWEMGAIYVDKGAEHCIIRNNEVKNCPVGIKSYGKSILISHNYVHDCNLVLKEWNWGPIGIWLGADKQEACYNRIINYRAESSSIVWPEGIGGGADGGAFEIDDARYEKSDIKIHHNFTADCQGFLEVTWTDVKKHPAYTDFHIHHNVSDDYQSFIAMWQGAGCCIENNTIVRRKKNANDWGVFNITQHDSRNIIRNNMIITECDIPVFNTGLKMDAKPKSVIENNLYYAASGKLVIGQEGPGSNPVFLNPFLKENKKVSAAYGAGIEIDSLELQLK